MNHFSVDSAYSEIISALIQSMGEIISVLAQSKENHFQKMTRKPKSEAIKRHNFEKTNRAPSNGNRIAQK
jgi:hypothetical protein